jgi:hypothetical protein
MLKKLLYLYNDGHNPFPNIGNHGLGYKLQNKRKRMHGKALVFQADGSLMFEPDANMTAQEALEANMRLFEGEREAQKSMPERVKDYEGDFEFYNTEETDLLNNKELQKIYLENELRNQGVTEAQLKLMFPDDEKSIPIKEPSKPIKEPSKPILKLTSNEDKIKIRSELEDKFRGLGKLKGIYKFETIFDNIVTKYPNLTYEEFMKDVSGYANGTREELKQLREEELLEKRNKREVNKKFKEGDTDNRGEAFELVMIEPEHQDELKEYCESKVDFGLCSNLPVFQNDDGTPITINKKNKITGETKKELFSKYSLYDISNPSTVTDCKYYPNQDYTSVQISKLAGSYDFNPCWNYDNKTDKYTLYNIWCRKVDKWVEPENNKDATIFSELKKGEKYNWSISKLINNWEKLPDGTNGCPMKDIIIQGKKYYVPDAEQMLKKIGKETYKRENDISNSLWFNINKSEMDFIKTKPKTKSKSKSKKIVKELIV